MIGQALLAITATAAGARRRDRDALADLERPGVHAHGIDHRRHFMAEHHRFTQAHSAETAVLVVMQIRPADTAAGDAYAQLVGGEGLRFILRADPQVF